VRGIRTAIAIPLGIFLTVFLVFPLTGLMLAAFVGETSPLILWVYKLDFGAFARLFSKLSLKYFAEFFTVPRYYQGFFNSVGVAPVIMAGAFVVALVAGKLAKDSLLKRRIRWLQGPGMLVLLAVICLLAAARPIWAPTPPPAGSPEAVAAAEVASHSVWATVQSIAAKVLSGDGVAVRLLQACGYCPLVTLASMFIGVGVAFCLHNTNMKGKRIFALLVIVPLSTPPFLGALAFKNLLGDFGMITRAFAVFGLSQPFGGQSALSAGLVQSFLFFPFVTLTTLAALERFDTSLPEASRVLGGSKAYGFLTATLPTLIPGILAGGFLAFIRSFGDFATLRLLLPNDYRMIVVEAYNDLSGNTYWGGATMLSTLMVASILVLLTLQKYVVEGGSYQTVTGRSGARTSLPSDGQSLADRGAFAFCCAVFAVPLAFLASTFLVSLARNWGAQVVPDEFTFTRYVIIVKSLFAEDSPLVNSFSLVMPALVGCLVMAFGVAFLISRGGGKTAQFLDFITVLPFVLPGVAFAVALIGVFNTPPIELHRTPFLVIIAYIVTRAPYAIRTILASFQQIGTSMEEGSRTMGASEILTLCRVTVPLVLPGIVAGAVMIFISCMQDVALTLMISKPDWYPTSVFAFKEIESGRIYEASAYGIVLFLIIVIPYSLLYFSKRFGVKAGL
jgi:iron(III) transport system permease protein